MKKTMKFLFAFALALCLAAPVHAQTPPPNQNPAGADLARQLPLPHILALRPPDIAGRISALEQRPQSPENALALGIALALAQKYPESEAALVSASAQPSAPAPLSGWAKLYLGFARFQQNDFQGALTALDGVDPEDQALGPEATLLAAYCLDILGDPAALARYRRFLAFSGQPMRPAALWRACVLAAAAGNYPESEQYAHELMQSFPWTVSAKRAESQIRELHQAGHINFDPDSPENLAERITLLLDKAQTAKAQAVIAQMEQTPGADPSRTLFLKGRALFNARQTRPAIQCFEDAAAKATDPALAAWALFHQGRAYWRLSSPEDAARMEELIGEALKRSHDIPDGAELALACRKLLVLSRMERGRFAEALPVALELARTVDIKQETADARQQGARLAGIIRFALADYQGAARQFEAFTTVFPQSDFAPAALYWTGRAREAAGDQEGARLALQKVLKERPNGYYGMLAARRLAGLGAGTPTDNQTDPCFGPGDPPIPEEAKPVFERAGLLEQGLLPELALHELTTLAARLPDDQAVGLRLARLATAQGDHQTAVRALTRAFPACLARGSRTGLLPLRDMLYPSRFEDDIAQNLAGSSVDIRLIQGLVRQESFFNPDAVSAAGAVGLMQILPSTAKTLAEKYGENNFDPATLKDPAVNIRLGVRYFLERYEEYGGNVAYALASYNAGRVKVDVWRKFLSGLDQELFIECIPYAETRDYVKRILRNQAMYALLY